MRSCLEIFEKEGTRREVAGNHPLVLSDPESVWQVASGCLEVFAVPFREGEATGARIHLFRAEPGQLLFGFPLASTDQLGLLAVGIPGSEVVRVAQSRLRETAGDPAVAAELALLLDQWIEGVTAGVARARRAPRVSLLNAGGERAFAADTVLSPGTGALWLANVSGSLAFLDLRELPVSSEGLFPLSCAGWVTLRQPTTLAAVKTESLLGDARLWSSLECFHEIILSCAALAREEVAAADLCRLQRRSRLEGQLIQGAISQLAAVVEPGEAGEARLAPEQDPLLAACRLVGARLGVSLVASHNYGEKAPPDPVGAIARASRVRTRRVILSGPWWRQDNGPLLAFRADDDRPVALLPLSSSAYEIVDPVENSRSPVTPAIAGALQPRAYCFYRPFPARAITARDLLRLGLAGTARDWLAIGLLGLAGGLLGLLMPIVTGVVFGRIIPGAERHDLVLLALALAGSALVMAIFQFTQGVAVLRLETRAASAVEAALWDRLLNLPASFFRQYTAGDLALRAMGISRIRQVLTEAAMTSLLSFLFSLLSFALLFYYDVRLAVLALVLSAAIGAVICLAALVQLRYERKNYEVRGRVAGLVLQLLSGISRVRVAGAENRALAFWAKDFSLQTRLAFQAQSVANGLATFMGAVPILTTMAIFAVFALSLREKLSLADFFAFNSAFAGVIMAAVMMSFAISSTLEVVPLYERAKRILETPPESHTAKRDSGSLSGNIEISHVSFRYHAQGPWVIEDVSLRIRPGEFLALVGPSGAGKSTILRLLLGFEVPTAGSVYYDREDLAGLDQQAIRRQIGVVLQGNRLTPGDIFSNITGNSPAYTLEDAWEAARLSGLDGDIRQMPMGMHTVITEGGGAFSGGQRQRLMIARAIISKPRVLLFDEATSALDNVTQAKVAQSLSNLKATRIVVAHRLSTVINADRICVVDRGKIVQQGTFRELIDQPGLFAELAKRQLLS